MQPASNLAFTYNATFLMDGMGSQLNRIYGIYALSRFLGVSYIHSPIKEIPYQGLLLSLEKNELDPQLVSRCNELFKIPSDREIPKHAKIFNVFRIRNDLPFLRSLKEELNKSSDFVLLKIGCPYFLVNLNPEMLHSVKSISPFNRNSSPIFKIAIHVRRGDLLISQEIIRMLPNSYYITLTLKIIEVLELLEIPFICELHTEIPSKSFIVTRENHAMKDRIKKPVTMTPESHMIEDFEVIPNLKKCINHDPIDSLQSLATADLLVMSRSAFSYLPAILNKKGIVVYHPFWCAAPLEWLDSTHQESFYERLLDACKKWKESNPSTLEHHAPEIGQEIPYDSFHDENQHRA